MLKAVLTSKDFWSGLLFMGMGATALILGNDLRVGTAARMGPGFVPHAIGWILIALGAANTRRADEPTRFQEALFG